MSDWEAMVHCTCFQDGLVQIEPPYPRAQLTVNRFGVVTLAGSTDHSRDPGDLWDWRLGEPDEGYGDDGSCRPCAHDRMRFVSVCPFLTPANWHRAYPPYPQVQALLHAFPTLAEIICRKQENDYASGGVWVEGDEAAGALEELERLLLLMPAGVNPGDAYFVGNLRELLRASAATKNPIIVHYNGMVDAW